MGNTLVHLVSEQTMQNLMPLMALRPERVVQIRSAADRYQKIAASLQNAAQEAGIEAEFVEEPLTMATPDDSDVRAKLDDVLKRFPGAVANLTGGTKLMFLGAYLSASQKKSPMLYCDTDRQRFVRVGCLPLPPMSTFPETARRLDVRIVMAAHGNHPEKWKFHSPDPAQLAFGRKAFELRWNHRESFCAARYSERIREFFRKNKGQIPEGKKDLTQIRNGNLVKLWEEGPPPEVIKFFDAAATAGFLIRENDGFLLGVREAEKKRELRQRLERIANLLDGSWLELSVMHWLTDSRRFIDPHWSVQPRGGRDSDDELVFGETDAICLDGPAGRLHLMSCKTSLHKPLEHLESLRQRANQLGGRYAQATLIVLEVNKGLQSQLRQWSRILRVECLIGSEVTQFFASSVPVPVSSATS